MRRYTLNFNVNTIIVGGVPVSASGAGGMRAVPIQVFWRATDRVEPVSTNQFVVAEAGIGNAPTLVNASTVWISVGVARLISGSKRGMRMVDTRVDHTNDDVFTFTVETGNGFA